jgi:hypothetical protein
MVTKLENGSRTRPSAAVIEAVAEYNGVNPIDLEQPLFDVIDPDALDALVGNDKSGPALSDTAIQFTYNDCRVHVSGEGSVDVSSARSK